MIAFTRRLLFLLAALAPAAQAQSLTLLTEDNPPFNFLDKGKVTGMSTEILSEMAARAGLKTTMSLIAWESAFQRAQTEKNTCVYSTARLDNRENLFQWTGPIATDRWAVFGKSDFSAPVKEIADLRKYKIGGVAADAKVEYLMTRAVTNIKLAGNDRQNPPKLFLAKDNPERIDLWITGYYAEKALAAQAKVSGLKSVFVAREQDLWLACSPRTDKDSIKKLADALAAMNKDGAIKKINEAYEKRFAP